MDPEVTTSKSWKVLMPQAHHALHIFRMKACAQVYESPMLWRQLTSAALTLQMQLISEIICFKLSTWMLISYPAQELQRMNWISPWMFVPYSSAGGSNWNFASISGKMKWPKRALQHIEGNDLGELVTKRLRSLKPCKEPRKEPHCNLRAISSIRHR